MTPDRQEPPPDPQLGPRFLEALALALHLHRDQARKGTRIPYVAHLLSVAALVLEHGGTEDEAIAALLHDAVEDQGGPPVLEEIQKRFGKPVAAIVEACTDGWGHPKPPWRARKTAYLTHLLSQPEPVRRVSAADKLHNVRAILADYRRLGEALWPRFTGGREGTLWYYSELAGVFDLQGPVSLARELRRSVDELKALSDGGATR